MSSAIFRQASRAARTASRSCAFSTSTVARKDLVQDLYIKELKTYKPAPVAKDAHVGAVKAFALPPKPQPPSLPANVAAELAAYDAQEPTKAEVKVAAASPHDGAPSVAGADTFLEVLEADLPKAAEHH